MSVKNLKSICSNSKWAKMFLFFNACQRLPHHALVFFVPHLNPLLPLVLVEFVLVQNSDNTRHLSVRIHEGKHGTHMRIRQTLSGTEETHFTSEGAAVRWTDSLGCGLPCCSRRTWPAPRRRQGGLPSLEGSRCRHSRFPLSPAGRTAAVWHPGLTLLTHPQGRTWHET